MIEDTLPSGARTWIAVAVSLVLHAGLIAATSVRRHAPQPDAAPSFAIDVEVAPTPDIAEALPPEMLAQAQPPLGPDQVPSRPEPTPPDEPEEPEEPPPKTPEEVAPPLDAGVPLPDAAPPAPEPSDAGTAIAATTTTDPVPTSAGSAANLLAYFPSGHVVTVLVRFDRMRGTEWAQVAQDVLSVMPDFETLVADPKTVVADQLDLIAISTPRPTDVGSSLVAMKSAITPGELRDFLDEPGAPVVWSRVSGGVLGTRKKGDRVSRGDRRLFLQPYDRWTVLARKKDLADMLDPVEGPLDDASADPARMPTWLAHLADIEAESGVPDGPALMMSLAPRSKKWSFDDFGLGVTEVKTPERLTLSLEIDAQGWQVKGNLKFAAEEDAQAFVDAVEAARTAALDSSIIKSALKRAKALNAVKGLTLRRTDRRVSYATSLSVSDARALSAVGILTLGAYFRNLQEEVDKAEP